MKGGSALSAVARAGLRVKGENEARRRTEEYVFVRPWAEMLLQLSDERCLTRALLAARFGMGEANFQDQFFHTRRARAPSVEEAVRLAGALNLRGIEKLEFLRLAKEARELVAKKRAAPTVAAREAILNAAMGEG